MAGRIGCAQVKISRYGVVIVSIIAAVFGFKGISAASADISRILFYVFAVIFIVLLVLGFFAARRI